MPEPLAHFSMSKATLSSEWQDLEPTFIGGVVEGQVVAKSEIKATPKPQKQVSSPQPEARSTVGVRDSGRAANHPTEVLRSRLLSAAIVLLFAGGVFFLRAAVLGDSPVPWLRTLVLVSTLLVIVQLTSGASLTLQRLRQLEILLFIPVGLQIQVLQYLETLAACENHDTAQILIVTYGTAISLAILMLSYAMLMPNGWKRTLVMLTPLAFAPAGVTVLARLADPFVAEVISWRQIVEIQVAFCVIAAIGVYGTRSIAALRNQVQSAQRLGQYKLKRLIERGGMGEVYLAEHRLLKRPCALKIISRTHDSNPEALEMFEREVRTTATLSHWNTVEIFDYGHTDDGLFYYVMEYLPGMNLFQLVERFGPMPPGRVIHFLRQTCQGLREAHQLGMVHRDLKPANIFAAKRGGIYDVAKLLDFGLVNLNNDRQSVEEGSQSKSNPIAGSPLFMSPEQGACDPNLDARSDIYSLGAVAYYLLTGRPPFIGRSALQVIIAHSRDVVVPPSQYVPSIPPDLETIVLQCLEKEPGQRFPSVVALEQELSLCLDAMTWSDSQATSWWHTYSPEIDRPISE